MNYLPKILKFPCVTYQGTQLTFIAYRERPYNPIPRNQDAINFNEIMQ